jgi:hypothetical protein
MQTSKQAGPATASGNLAGQQPQQTRVTAADDALTRKKACAAARPTNEQPPGLAADASPAPLGSLPPELWDIFLKNRTWAADRTIMLRMTSKRVKETVDKARPSAVVRWRMSFLDAKFSGKAAEKLAFVLRQLTAMTDWCRITTIELFFDEDRRRHPCVIKGQDAKRLARVLAQCPALTHLNLSGAEAIKSDLPGQRVLQLKVSYYEA